MKKILLIIAIMLFINVPIFCEDQPDTWAVDIIEEAKALELLPESMLENYKASITREEFCILAIRMIEVKSQMTIEEYLKKVNVEIAPIGTFTDCDTYEVRAAKSLEITKGTTDTTFSPNQILTRQEAATFLTKTSLACGQNVDMTIHDYADLSSIASWAKPYVGYTYNADIMKGIGNNNFAPLKPYQRQQAFITVYKLYLAINEVKPENVSINREATDYPEGIGFIDEPHTKEEIESMLIYKPYEEDYMATYKGTYTTSDGVEKLQKNIYYRAVNDNIQIREDIYSNTNIASISIYNDTAYTTFIRMYKFSNYAETVDGNWLEFKYLNLNVLDEMTIGEDIESFNVVLEKNSDVLEIIYFLNDGSFVEVNYSMKNRMPIYYKRTTYDGLNKNIIEYELVDLDESYDILDFIMDTDSIN